jgi:hypothetical protein
MYYGLRLTAGCILVEKSHRIKMLSRSERIWNFNIEKELKELSFDKEKCPMTGLYIRELMRSSSRTKLLDKCVFIEKIFVVILALTFTHL